MDEYGLMEGQGTNGMVVGSVKTRAVQRKDPGSRAWTSFIECISATGVALPPAVIFKGKSVQQQWFPVEKDGLDDWLFTATEKGWTDRAVALEWLQRVFIPLTKPKDPTHARLLILDGHDSYTADDFMWYCFQNNVHLVFLPAHTSHVLQPLDLSIFSPLKHAYRKYLNNINTWAESTVVGKRTMLRCLLKARQDAITARNIKTGWKAAGLWPVSMAKPLMSRLLLENSNNSAKDYDLQHLVQTPAPRKSTRPTLEATRAVLATPRKTSDRGLTLITGHPSYHTHLRDGCCSGSSRR
jgi:4-hydroxybenzoate polyprenyltransferase